MATSPSIAIDPSIFNTGSTGVTYGTTSLGTTGVSPSVLAGLNQPLTLSNGLTPGQSATQYLQGYANANPINLTSDTGNGWGSLNLGQKLNTGLQGLQTIGGLIAAFGSLGLARDSFNLQKDVLNTNLNNQIKSYNTALEDKARSRGVMEGQSSSEVQSYIDSHKATR